jgi:transcriptional regulator with XRE-family HTH domain
VVKRDTTGYYAVPSLRQERERKLLTQAQLASQAGVSRSAIVAAEKGARIRIFILERLAQALQVEKQALTAIPAPGPSDP